jgi:hypothetical protein
MRAANARATNKPHFVALRRWEDIDVLNGWPRPRAGNERSKNFSNYRMVIEAINHRQVVSFVRTVPMNNES